MQFSIISLKDGVLGNKLSHATRLPTTDPIAISKIYPTPPSVENSDKRYDDLEVMEDTHPTVAPWEGEVSPFPCSLSNYLPPSPSSLSLLPLPPSLPPSLPLSAGFNRGRDDSSASGVCPSPSQPPAQATCTLHLRQTRGKPNLEHLNTLSLSLSCSVYIVTETDGN